MAPERSREVEKAVTSTLNPVEVRPVIAADPEVMTGAALATVTLLLGAGEGSTVTPPSVSCVRVTVTSPATVPCWNAPFWGSVTAVAPAATVKVTVFPPAANCIAGSL